MLMGKALMQLLEDSFVPKLHLCIQKSQNPNLAHTTEKSWRKAHHSLDYKHRWGAIPKLWRSASSQDQSTTFWLTRNSWARPSLPVKVTLPYRTLFTKREVSGNLGTPNSSLTDTYPTPELYKAIPSFCNEEEALEQRLGWGWSRERKPTVSSLRFPGLQGQVGTHVRAVYNCRAQLFGRFRHSGSVSYRKLHWTPCSNIVCQCEAPERSPSFFRAFKAITGQ